MNPGTSSSSVRRLAANGWGVLSVVGLAAVLLAILDVKRGFLSADYAFAFADFKFSALQGALALSGALSMTASLSALRRDHRSAPWLGLASAAVLVLLLSDLLAYRGIGMARSAAAGRVSKAWMEAWGAKGWLLPLAQAASYLASTWHAVLLSVLLAGLAMVALPARLEALLRKGGLAGTLLGAVFALPQPFCSCCAALISPGYARRGASTQFLLAFVVGAPMLNLTTLLLAFQLLPLEYALLRLGAGLALALPLTVLAARLAERFSVANPAPAQPSWLQVKFTALTGAYCRLFHVDELLAGRGQANCLPGFFRAWGAASLRLAALMLPLLFFSALLSSALVALLPAAFGNNLGSVAASALAGTLMMVATWTEIPVAQEMLAQGWTGPAAVMLVVLPAVSLPCLFILAGALQHARSSVWMLGLGVMLCGAAAGLLFL